MTPLTGPILTAAETRAAEDAAIAGGVSVAELMERAGACVAEAVWRFGGGQSTLILCGPGNNGGDGYVAARLLRGRGLDVRVAALREPRAPAAIDARSKWDGPVEPLQSARPAAILVDALFGTGLRRTLEPETSGTLYRLADAARFILAVDVPSGVDTDQGVALGAVRCNATIALAALKPAHLLQPAAGFCGHILLGQIGIKADSRVQVLDRPSVPRPVPQSHKYARGLVIVVQGEMEGASALAARAAQRAGAGYVVLTGEDGVVPASIVRRTAETALADARLSSIVIGCGLGRSVKAQEQVNAALAIGKPLVLDADALALVDPAQLKQRQHSTILTPHEGEFVRLFGALDGSKIDRARLAAARCGQIVILKGADTVIAAPDGRVRVARPASHWLASAGTGDVLAGIAGTMAAQLADPFDAACAAVWLHAEAARRAGPAFIADDLPERLPSALAAAL
jgi:ADP-dependent NAD(P)H-hydrate dehydratase / NAD(P)H-hydrate epimerase